MAGNERNIKVKIDHVEKIYEGRKGRMVALNGIDLDIMENEFICVVGPSGCGKSTLLNIIAGLLPATSGAVYVDGKKVEGTGTERGVVELEEFVDAYPKELSGGMKQRVAIARAYAVQPEVLLMDEPFGALDAQTRTQLQSELTKTWQEEKKTCFFITHDVEEAVILATKVIIMSARPGRIKKIVDINLPYPRTQEMKMELPFLDLKTYIWGEVYQEYLEVRK